MNSLTTEQIARVFAMYAGQQIQMIAASNNEPFYYNTTLQSKTDEPDTVSILIAAEWWESASLVLSPLSAITDEDAIEVAKINGWDVNYSDELIKWGRSVVANLIETDNGNTDINFSFDTHPLIFTFQHLIQQGYAVPLFIAPDHPDNGKTAIEMGLAIDSTTM